MSCYHSLSVRPALALRWCVVTGLKASSRLKWECSVSHQAAFPMSLTEVQRWFIDKRIYALVMPEGPWDATWFDWDSLVQLMQGVWAHQRVLALARGHSTGGSQSCFVFFHFLDNCHKFCYGQHFNCSLFFFWDVCIVFCYTFADITISV